jgi:hypothetical protein
MTKDEEVKTLLIKYGAIELSRNYIRGVRNALANIKNGIATDNFALASRDVGSLEDNLSKLELIFASEDGRKQLQHNLKK